MLPIDPLWVYVAVPAVLVSLLIMIKLGQKEMDKILSNEYPEEEVEQMRTHEEKTTGAGSSQVDETETKPENETSEKPKPPGCNNHMGYLYMKKAPNETHIPTECYNCPDLLKCLYSPVIVEKVYGE